MTKKEMVLSFFKMLPEQKVREAYDSFIAPEFKHHNQYFKGDRESLMLGQEQAHKEYPDVIIEVKHIFEDGDYVITHSLVKMNKEDLGQSSVHTFRFDNDKIVEMWDVFQAVWKDSPNENGPF